MSWVLQSRRVTTDFSYPGEDIEEELTPYHFFKEDKRMSTTGLEVFDSTLQKTNSWLSDIMQEMGWEGERQRAYLALRSVLHALRDRLTVEEALDLGAQLPMLIRGFYYEGWKVAGKPLKERRRADFLAHIQQDFRNDERMDPEAIARAVFNVIARRVSIGEIEDIKQILPAELRELWNPEAGRTLV